MGQGEVGARLRGKWESKQQRIGRGTFSRAVGLQGAARGERLKSPEGRNSTHLWGFSQEESQADR